MAKYLVLGDGRLAKEILNQQKWHSISRNKDGFDIRNVASYVGYLRDYDVILNTIGCTNTYSLDRKEHWEVNYKAIADLADYCESIGKKKLIHISTDYIYGGSKHEASEEDVPVHAPNWYSYCKLLSDAHIQMRMTNYLLIRTSFKTWPYSYPTVPNQIGNFDYIDVITNLIIKLIKGNAQGVYNVGTELKSIYDLALQSNKNIISTNGKINETMPTDVSMDNNKLKLFLKGEVGEKI